MHQHNITVWTCCLLGERSKVRKFRRKGIVKRVLTVAALQTNQVADGTKHLPHLWDLCSSEIVGRSAKHILKDVLRDKEDHDIAPAISHFFNCFFGSIQAVGSSSCQQCVVQNPQKGPRRPSIFRKAF